MPNRSLGGGILKRMRRMIELMEEYEGRVKFCSSCGEVNYEDSKFCDRCGAGFPAEKPTVKVKRILDEV
ncbi:MAG: zinc-ribbon domain-containing protein [Candidatus Bathyarchaeia archaeon]